MKIIPIALKQSSYDVPASHLCRCLYLERRDGLIISATTLDKAITVSGTTYTPGAEIMDLVMSAGLAVDNTELTVFPDDATDPGLRDDLLSGRWNNASFRIFEVNYKAPTDGINTLMRGTFGEVTTLQLSAKVELRSNKQALQQPVGSTTSPTCRARFADYPTPVVGNHCTLSPTDWMVAGTVDSVLDNQTFGDTSRAEPDDWFGEGLLYWTSGANIGLEQKVKVYEGTSDGGVFTLSQAMYFDVQIGDEYSVIAGCRKRHEITTANPSGVSDCKTKFNNVVNFQGEPQLQGIDAITSAPDRSGA